jgi:purine-binding chemotaxis protein CheW
MKTLKEMRRESAVAADLHTEKYLMFYIDGQLYTVPTSQVVEIIRMQPITYMPNTIDYVKGVINLRGKVVPVIDMRLRFKKEERPYDSRTSIVIVENGGMTVGLIVDTVKDVRDISAAQINESPKSKGSTANGKNFVCGIISLEDESAMLLNTAKVLTHHSRTLMQDAEKKAAATNAAQP